MHRDISEAERLMEGMSNVQLEAIIAYCRMVNREEPNVSPEAIHLLYQTVIRASEVGASISEEIFAKLSAMVNQPA